MADKILSQRQLAAFCCGMSMLLRSGAGPEEAAGLFAADSAGMADTEKELSPRLRQAAREMEQALAAGAGFREAAQQTEAFPAYALGVFRTAETAGRLEEALAGLAEYYERQARLADRLRSTVTYPAALLLMMCGVLAVLVFGVLPMFLRVYSSLTGSVAASSYAYVPVASAIGWISLLLTALVCAVLLAALWMSRMEAGRRRLRRSLEKWSLTGRALQLSALSQMLDTMATMLASGQEEAGAVAFCREQAEHAKLRQALSACEEDVARGSGLGQVLVRRKMVPGLYGRLLLSGEESGNLPAAMNEVSCLLGREAEEEMDRAMDRVEPVLIGFLTLAVGFTLLSVMLPLLGIVSGV